VHELYRLLVDEKGSGDGKKSVSGGLESNPLKHLNSKWRRCGRMTFRWAKIRVMPTRLL